MKIPRWIAAILRNRQPEPGFRELLDVEREANRLTGAYDHGELAKLIRKYRHSEKAIEKIAMQVAKSYPFHSPASTMNKGTVEMMKALKDTRFMKKCGHRLSAIVPQRANMVQGMLAMYTFMRDAYLKKLPKTGGQSPSSEEVEATMRILDCQRSYNDVSELCGLASDQMMPSKYVMIRYGLEDKCDTYNFMEKYLAEHDDYEMEAHFRNNYAPIAADMCRAAEKAVEGIKGACLSDRYLENLDRELHVLGRIAVSPDAVDDPLHIDKIFLFKYGIDITAAPEEQSRQAQKAYKELDDRLVKITVRRPYADGLFASIRQGKEKTAEADSPKQVHKPILRNPPSKGRKMGL
ncbi:hypothetical protein JQN09_14895 [Phocaeicola dorei]|uniref:hypothetical protein n=1 Tax=Phocaeicola dorei TaxID=357276 RepID=UPI001BDE76BC|nr:hypothetical protein [Phocaeicola dorei]MBT1308494.1 hypothetical protein [Phocaeicola dorei]MBT1313205.1 hypothetical protein [Phocaeicola dorei]